VYNDLHQYDLLEDYDEVLPLNQDSIHKHRHAVHDHEQEMEE
jgi:hypothetical protein